MFVVMSAGQYLARSRWHDAIVWSNDIQRAITFKSKVEAEGAIRIAPDNGFCVAYPVEAEYVPVTKLALKPVKPGRR